MIGIDYGQARIGLSISDGMKIIARPIGHVKACRQMQRNALNVIKAVEAEENIGNIDTIVVGFPRKLSGKISLMGDEVNLFIEKLQEVVSMPIIRWDERMTTLQATRAMKEANMNRKKRSKIIDTMSAVIILQSYLDYVCQ